MQSKHDPTGDLDEKKFEKQFPLACYLRSSKKKTHSFFVKLSPMVPDGFSET
jgi:hypothetical protein